MLISVVLLAFLAGIVSTAPQKEPERHQVIVVGAGASGFTAAVTLLEHNVTDVLVLEASDRIGGRVNTVEFDGVFIDKGAEYVHGQDGNSVYELIKSYDFLTSNRARLGEDACLFVNTSGHTFNSSVAVKIFDEAFAIFDDEAMVHFNGTVADYFNPRFDALLHSKNLEPHVEEAFRHLVPLLETTNSAVSDLSEMGAWGFSDVGPTNGDITQKWKLETKGYKTLFDVLSKKFPNPKEELPVNSKIVFGKEVSRIERKEGEVEVTCTDGSTYVADHVIVTVSLGFLKKHAASMFHPELPQEKTEAIQSLGFGCLGKVWLVFPTRWWPNGTNLLVPLFSRQELQDFVTTSKHGSWTSHINGFEQMLNHDRMLRVWLSGQDCHKLDVLTEEELIDGSLELLNKMFGQKYNIPRPEKILRSNWATYPFTLGSYSFRTVESDRKNITNSDLAGPIFHGEKPVVLFAGEATNHDHPGLVNGALDTGRREAQNILNYLNKKS